MLLVGCGATAANTIAEPAPGYTSVVAATDLAGNTVGPANGDTEATVVIVFASWCNPCKEELRMLGELRTEEPRMRVVGVNAYEEYDDRSDMLRLQSFLAAEAPWLQVVPADQQIMAALGTPKKVPTMFVYRRDGTLAHAFLRTQGPPPDKADVRAVLDEIF
jgi:thiol-disulfide isomerase/thioredoxin